MPSKRIRLILQVGALFLLACFMLLATVLEDARAGFGFLQPHIRTLVVVGLVASSLSLLLVMISTRTTRNRTRVFLILGLVVNLGAALAVAVGGSLHWISASQGDGIVLAPVTSTNSTTMTESKVTPKKIRNVFIVGDSAIAGLRLIPDSQIALQGFNVTLDLESCRRLVKHNCKSREGRKVDNALDTILNRSFGEHDTLIVGVGYNDKSTNFSNDFDEVVNAARSRGFSQIIWLTYRETSDYILPGVDYTSDYTAMNEILRGKIASGTYGDVIVADLWMYTSSATEWFVRDGVHYKLYGAFGVADFISRTIASVDGAPCHKPWMLGGSVETPCPRPEAVVAQRGLVDLAGLYGI